MPEEICREGWKSGMLTAAQKDGLIFAMEKSGNAYIGRSFIVDLKQYRKPIPSEKNGLDWGKTSVPEQMPYRGEAVVFEISEGKVVGWCSLLEFRKASFERVRKTVKAA